MSDKLCFDDDTLRLIFDALYSHEQLREGQLSDEKFAKIGDMKMSIYNHLHKHTRKAKKSER